jgi:hypothetical protein
MKKLVLLLGIAVSLNAFGQSSGNIVYMGQDENNAPIYKNVKPFSSFSAKAGITIAVSGITAFIIYVFTDKKKEEVEVEETFEQENVEI